MTSDESIRAADRPFTMAQPNPPMLLLYLTCGHKGLRSGAMFRGKLPMLCPACVDKLKGKT